MKKKILIVEDEIEALNAIKSLLEERDFEVVTALDGEEGLLKARSVSPDLILLDLMLPKMNGFVVSRLLRFDEKYRNIPIIIMTAKAEEQDIELGRKVGALEYIIKPIKLDVLLEKIKTVLLNPPASDD